MLDRTIQWALTNRLVTLACATLLLAAGGYAAFTMPVDVFPDLTAPRVTVITESHGMAPEEVEKLVTYPIETAVNGAASVRRVRSSSAQGYSIVWVEFEWGTDIYQARQIVSEKLQLVGGQLPEGVDAPVMAPITSIMGEILLVGLTSQDHSMREVRTAADRVVRRRLLAVDGVAQVIPHGGEVKAYQVIVDQERTRALGISLSQVMEAAEGSNENAAGGVYQQDGREVLIRGVGRTNEIEEIGATVVTSRDGAPIRLRDVAEVKVGTQRPRLGTGSVSGEPGVIVSIQKQPGANTLDLTERVSAELDQIEGQLPAGMEVNRSIFRQADFISLAVSNVIEALRDGALLVVLILFLFLWNVRTTAISILAIPLSLSVALVVMYGLGITINTMTLGGLAIAIGALVDDAIIDVENVFRRLKENAQRPEGEQQSVPRVVYEASMEVRGPILNATLIISVVFVPLFFLSGVQGRLLQPLGLAYIVAILASLFVAVTVTPVLCYYLLPQSSTVQEGEDTWLVRRLHSAYRSTLDWVLGRSRFVLGAAALLLAATLATLPFMGRGFLPEFQEGTLVISAVTAPGTGLQASTRIAQEIEDRLLEHPAVEATSRRTGRAELSAHAQGANASEIDVQVDLSEREMSEVTADVRSALSSIPGTNITIGQPIGHRIDHMLSGTRTDIALKIFGPDLYELRDLAGQVRGAIEGTPGLVDLSVARQADVPQLRLYPKRQEMAKYGVTPGHLNHAVEALVGGEAVSQVREGQLAFGLTVRLDSARRAGAESIRNLLIDTPTGPTVPVSRLAKVQHERGPNTISREDVQRKIVVSANTSGRDVGSVVADLQRRISGQVDIPENYYYEVGGQYENARQASRRIGWLSLVALLVVFLLLYQEFGSARAATLVLVNLPLALTGGVAALFLFLGGTLDIAAMVGFVTLFGIAVRNGILLVSHYITLLQEDKSLREAVLQGSMERLNPILMTALTAGLALVPLALGGGEPGKEIQTPLAIVTIGGLLTSTFLNMVVVPVLFDRFGDREALRSASENHSLRD
ncbi:CzcA family heavy metal efflux pump [Salinibacter ruber]|uniref:CzcA family heavy metal efflux pump n=1 Tax=Salinibacter ruber TaxID=146919 RepID=A0A9X2UUI2_9BACT|nr:efflux RND transporter permease subunit [Salinibacter ruber]MCS3661520.1 CzcA family heavy metal efflux pump [Salinibacter ruber]MCS3701872.1 CzcA family heavy metal efflux pump [Salinibacter ruber]MCS3711253.1 CzcA family heavy metal efflux pump [Salinibacter ruber]MCS3755022.1 CzcA family heavy metal efflux pump [Salinibacter ruber]MCS4047640.1 CzcA family heavy metal efflux pump [Salinibacter ruber]